MEENNHHFIIERWEKDPRQTIVSLDKDATIQQAVEAFEEFLHAVGYRLPDNHIIDIIPTENENPTH